MHWVSGQAPTPPYQCSAKTRYRQQDAACTITQIENGLCEIVFDEPQWAITPGQSTVIYKDEECLGGGIIQSYTKNS
jgi:tRNA-specific 2-thiouridylase